MLDLWFFTPVSVNIETGGGGGRGVVIISPQVNAPVCSFFNDFSFVSSLVFVGHKIGFRSPIWRYFVGSVSMAYHTKNLKWSVFYDFSRKRAVSKKKWRTTTGRNGERNESIPDKKCERNERPPTRMANERRNPPTGMAVRPRFKKEQPRFKRGWIAVQPVFIKAQRRLWSKNAGHQHFPRKDDIGFSLKPRDVSGAKIAEDKFFSIRTVFL